jgi:hypothetical protein
MTKVGKGAKQGRTHPRLAKAGRRPVEEGPDRNPSIRKVAGEVGKLGRDPGRGQARRGRGRA